MHSLFLERSKPPHDTICLYITRPMSKKKKRMDSFTTQQNEALLYIEAPGPGCSGKSVFM